MTHHGLPLPLPILAALATLAPVAARAQSCGSVSGLDSIVQSATSQVGLRGTGLRVEQSSELLYERWTGSYGPGRTVPIASASKWLSAAVLMSLVDDGSLSLDDPVVRYLPSFTGTKATITLRQCFSHTSGLPANSPLILNNSLTLEQAVNGLAQLPLVATPGTAFLYGGVSMHVAGRVCEVVSGRSWAELFDQRIARPLQMASTDYYAFGATENPRIASGVRSSLRDYARFVEMLRAGGRFGGRPVLSAASVTEMFRDQTSGLRVISTPHPNGAPYGIGTWIERQGPGGEPLVVSGAGAFGFFAWVDLEWDVGGTFLVLDHYRNVYPFEQAMVQLVRDHRTPLGTACVGAAEPACASPLFLTTNGVPKSGSSSFALLGSGLTANAPAAVLLGLGVDPVGTPLEGTRLYLPLMPAPLLASAIAGAGGIAEMAVPIPPSVTPGSLAGAQLYSLDPLQCSGSLRASQALALNVRAP